MLSLIVLKQLVIMLVIALCGFTFAKVFKVTEGEQKFLSKLLLYFINPFLVFNSFVTTAFSVEKLKNMGIVAVVSLIIHFFMIGLAFLTIRKNSENQEEEDYNIIDRLTVIFTNCGFVGIPLISSVFGAEGVLYLIGFLVCFNILLWTFGYKQMSGKMNIKKIITNPNIIAVFLGLFFYCTQIKLPEVIFKPMNLIAEMNSPLAMILIGILFASFKFDKKFLFRIVRTCFLRLIGSAILSFCVIFVFYKILLAINFQTPETELHMMLFVPFICSMCPSATSVPSLSCLFEKDAKYSSLLVCLTTMLCVLTIPALLALAELVIK